MQRFLDNGIGEGGCKYGKNCKFGIHLKMCDKSLKTRTCPNAKKGTRCDNGYHLSGTKMSIDNGENERKEKEKETRSYSDAVTNRSSKDTNKDETDFLVKEVRKEVGAILKPLSSLLQKLMKEI